MLKKCCKLYKDIVCIYIMLFRDNNGNIINISRLDYSNDKIYYNTLRNLYKLNKKEKKQLIIENTNQYNTLMQKLM